MYIYGMGYALAVIFFFVAWKGLPSTVFLPYAISFVTGVAAFLFIKFLKPKKSLYLVAASALVFVFFIVAVIDSLSFPASMADGEHFRSIIPFLNVSFH